MNKVSVIIPFYNAEEYIVKCISSVINQTLDDIEIILINDCSTDNSYDIVLDYAKNDKRIILLNTNKQSGQSYARNLGLANATGEYIGFVDADDWISVDMFEKMYNRAKKDNTDITMCKAQLYDTKEQKYKDDDYYGLKVLEKIKEKCFSSIDTKDEILDINVVIWNKLYKREFLKKINAKFQEGYIYEDLPFFFETYLKAEKINIVWEELYYYRQNNNLSTMKNTDKKIFDRIPMMELSYNILKEYVFFSEKQLDIVSWIIDDIFHRYTLIEDKYYMEYYYKMKTLFESFNLCKEQQERLDKSYCYDEYCNILKCSCLEFFGYLIEKYKTSNKLIKDVKHQNNVTIAKMNEYWEKYSREKENEKQQINAWWKQHCEEEIKQGLEKEIENRLNTQFEFLESKKSYEMKKLYEEMYDKLLVQEQELKKWQTESVRQAKEQLTAEYEQKLENLHNQYQTALREQKEYYEYHFLFAALIFKLYKFSDKVKYKIKKLMNKN